MSFKLLTISSMYDGYLNSFYKRNGNLNDLSYDDHYNMLMNDTTEFAGSYTKTFIRQGIDARCIIANDNVLQKKWITERKAGSNDLKDVLSEQVHAFQPDVLWIENLSYTNNEWLQAIRRKEGCIKLIIAYHCSPFSKGIEDRLTDVDFVITCTPGLKEDIEKKGFRSFLVYHGFDTNLAARVINDGKEKKNGFIFSGSLSTGAGFHAARIEIVEKMLQADIDIDLYVNLEKRHKILAKQLLFRINSFVDETGMSGIRKLIPALGYWNSPVRPYSARLLRQKKDPVFGIDMYNLFARSKIVLNMHIGIAGNYAGNMRMFEVTGTGSCLLTDNKSNLTELFIPGEEIVVYNDVNDCIEKVKWLMENEEERRKIASAGQSRTLNYHTVNKRCLQIIGIIEEELKK